MPTKERITVERLIRMLQEYPPHAYVYLDDWNEAYAPDHPLEEITEYAMYDEVRVCLGVKHT